MPMMMNGTSCFFRADFVADFVADVLGEELTPGKSTRATSQKR